LGIGALTVAAPLGKVPDAVPPSRGPVGFQCLRGGQLRIAPVVDKPSELVADLGIRPAEVTGKLPVGLGQGEITRQPMRVARALPLVFRGGGLSYIFGGGLFRHFRGFCGFRGIPRSLGPLALSILCTSTFCLLINPEPGFHLGNSGDNGGVRHPAGEHVLYGGGYD
jgi:hypothetical protein